MRVQLADARDQDGPRDASRVAQHVGENAAACIHSNINMTVLYTKLYSFRLVVQRNMLGDQGHLLWQRI